MSLTVMMYHDVRDLKDTFFPKRYQQKSFMREADFISQIKYIQKNYKIISIDKLLKLKSVREKLAILTFDDGLKDHRKVASILEEYNLPATFFLPVDPIITRRIMKTHKIQFIIGETDLQKTSKEILSFFPEKLRDDLWSEYSRSDWKDNHWTNEQIFITNILRKYSDKNKVQFICDELFAKYVTVDENCLAKDLYLSMEDVKYLNNSKLFTVGGHGYISENLITFKKRESWLDIKKCTEFLKKLDIKKFYMSYPNGGYNVDIVDFMRSCGYLVAFTTGNRIIENLHMENMLTLPRLDAAQKLVIS